MMQPIDKPLVRVAVLLAAIGILGFFLQQHPGWLDDTLLWHIPEGVGALGGGTLAAIAGLFVLRAARIQAKATKDAAARQVDAAHVQAKAMERAAKQQAEAVSNAQRREMHSRDSQQQQERNHRRKAVVAALQGELIAAHKRILHQLQIMEVFRTTYQHGDRVESLPDLFPRIDTPMYVAYASEIGLLPVELIRQLSEVYGRLLGLRALSIDDAKGISAVNVIMLTMSALKGFSPQLEEAIRALEQEARR